MNSLVRTSSKSASSLSQPPELPKPLAIKRIVSNHLAPYFYGLPAPEKDPRLYSKLFQAKLVDSESIALAIEEYCLIAIWRFISLPKVERFERYSATYRRMQRVIRKGLERDFPAIKTEDAKAAIQSAFNLLRTGPGP